MEINHDFYKMAEDRILKAKVSALTRFDGEQGQDKGGDAIADTEREDSDSGEDEGKTTEEKAEENKEEDDEVTFF
jgi:hypothetical protein